jgi:hypothetical protein
MIVKVTRTGVQLAVPSWMLDATFCQQLVDEPGPRVGAAALLDLADLLEAQPLLAAARGDGHQRRRK